MSNLFDLYATAILRHLGWFLVSISYSEVNPAPYNLFKSDPSWFVFLRVNINAWACATLKLLTSLGRENNQAVL